jgi:hypothetical protein
MLRGDMDVMITAYEGRGTRNIPGIFSRLVGVGGYKGGQVGTKY